MSRVSLVVPLQDEAGSVVALVRSIAALSRQPDEIVLVDAGSVDGTADLARREGAGLPLRIVREDRVHPGTARNRGVAASTGAWIAFTDGGIRLDPLWLAELLASSENGDAVWGNCDPVCDSLFRECSALAYVPARDRSGGRGPFIASSLIRRTAFDRAGGFPPHRAAEDLVFFERLKKSGALFAVAPRARVYWEIAGSPGRLFRRFALYSRHNLAAGWERHWHCGLARSYAALALAAALAGAALGPAASVVLFPLFLLARAGKAAWTKRRSFPFRTLHPARILGAAAVLLVIDAATLVGLLGWLREGRPRQT